MFQWIWLVIILAIAALLGLLIWWLLYRRGEEELVPGAKPEGPPDNLARIEGIGPKISGLLQAAGITTFAQLAATDVDRLEQILTDADLGALTDPKTWPEQARLAAVGEWDRLEVLQDELKGGRQV